MRAWLKVFVATSAFALPAMPAYATDLSTHHRLGGERRCGRLPDVTERRPLPLIYVRGVRCSGTEGLFAEGIVAQILAGFDPPGWTCAETKTVVLCSRGRSLHKGRSFLRHTHVRAPF